MQLWVGLLGPFEVRWAGQRVALAGAKQRALFAMLALRANAPISVDELVERVWSSSSPRRPTKTVQVHVARLRAALGEAASCVVTTPTGYLLRVDEEQVDLTRFERLLVAGQAALTEGDPQGAGDELAAALALWRGAPLADFAHEEFAQEEIRRLQELRLSALEARLEADLQLGRHGAVVAELDALVREHPLRERLHAQRMLALYRCGRQAEALDTFQRARRVLVEQIGIEPGPELRQLHEAILRHDASLALYEQLFTSERRLAESAGGASAHGLKSADAGRATVPVPPSPLLGRGPELDRLRALLDLKSVRLITVVGIGGVGKTRLAVELARELVATGSQVAWVALAPVAAADHVAATIARSLSVTPAGGESAKAALLRILAVRQLVLVLDNFEHVASAAPLVGELLAGAAGLRTLVTSREPLRLRAERVFPLAPLALPSGDAQPDALHASPATALFLATATARHPELELTREDASAVAELCRYVDGLPLAIELAAGRLGVLSAHELAAQMRSGQDPLGTAPRDAPERHRTLRDTLAWSFRLLTTDEQAAFARFAVFAGGAGLDAARTVTGAELNTLEELVAKHLLTINAEDGGVRRLGMLETVRRFAGEQLEARRDAAEIRQRHADYFLARAEAATPELRRRGPAALFRSLDRELPNMRNAMTWALAHDQPETCVRLAVALDEYWALYDPQEALRWLRAGLDAAGDELAPRLGARALTSLAGHLGASARDREAETTARGALDIARGTGDPATTVQALMELAYTLLVQHRNAEAYPVAVDAQALASTTDDHTLIAETGLIQAACAPTLQAAMQAGAGAGEHFEQAGHARRVLYLYGVLTDMALAEHNDSAAQEFMKRALAAAERVPPERGRTSILGTEGFLLLVTGNLHGARRAFATELRLAQQQSLEDALGEGLYGLAAVDAAERRHIRAAQLAAAAQALIRDPVHPTLRDRLDQQYFAPSRRLLGEACWEEQAAIGRRLSLPEALQLSETNE